jgi:outer membrane lipoprotein carrier protein
LPIKAQLKSFECAKEVSDPNILKSVQSSYESVKSLSANFKQYSFLKALKVEEFSSGTLLFGKPGRMKWLYVEPEPQEFYLFDKTFWLVQPKEKQVIIDNVEEILLGDLPVAFLMGLGNLERDFLLNKSCLSLGEVDTLVLTLSPKKRAKSESDNELRSFTLLVDKEKHLPRGAKVLDISQNITAITFQGINVNPKVADNDFMPILQRNFDVQDQRKDKKILNE